MGYHLVPRIRELLEAEAAHDAAAGRRTLPEPLRALLREADAATVQRAATAQGYEEVLHSLYLRAVCVQAIAEKNPLVELFPWAKGSMGTYRDAHQLLRELRAGEETGLAPGTSVKIAVSIHEEAV
jgi:hypothetical protein